MTSKTNNTAISKQVLQYRKQCIRDFGEDMRCWTILATAPDDNLYSWIFQCAPDVFDRRKKTLRCRLWINEKESDQAVVLRTVKAAKLHDVTIQLLCIQSVNETYPIIHLASHKLKW